MRQLAPQSSTRRWFPAGGAEYQLSERRKSDSMCDETSAPGETWRWINGRPRTTNIAVPAYTASQLTLTYTHSCTHIRPLPACHSCLVRSLTCFEALSLTAHPHFRPDVPLSHHLGPRALDDCFESRRSSPLCHRSGLLVRVAHSN